MSFTDDSDMVSQIEKTLQSNCYEEDEGCSPLVGDTKGTFSEC